MKQLQGAYQCRDDEVVVRVEHHCFAIFGFEPKSNSDCCEKWENYTSDNDGNRSGGIHWYNDSLDDNSFVSIVVSMTRTEQKKTTQRKRETVSMVVKATRKVYNGETWFARECDVCYAWLPYHSDPAHD